MVLGVVKCKSAVGTQGPDDLQVTEIYRRQRRRLDNFSKCFLLGLACADSPALDTILTVAE